MKRIIVFGFFMCIFGCSKKTEKNDFLPATLEIIQPTDTLWYGENASIVWKVNHAVSVTINHHPTTNLSDVITLTNLQRDTSFFFFVKGEDGAAVTKTVKVNVHSRLTTYLVRYGLWKQTEFKVRETPAHPWIQTSFFCYDHLFYTSGASDAVASCDSAAPFGSPIRYTWYERTQDSMRWHGVDYKILSLSQTEMRLSFQTFIFIPPGVFVQGEGEETFVH